MKSALSRTLIICLVGSTVPLAAQEPTGGPIARAAARAAGRLTFAPQTSADDSEWLRLRNLASGTEIIVALRGSRTLKRYFVRADDSGLFLSRTANGARDQALMPAVQPSSGRAIGERVARAEVAQIVTETTERTKAGTTAGALLGLGGGIALGAWRAVHAECPGTQEGQCLATDFFLLPALFTAAGAVAGHYAFGHTTGHVVYRAP